MASSPNTRSGKIVAVVEGPKSTAIEVAIGGQIVRATIGNDVHKRQKLTAGMDVVVWMDGSNKVEAVEV